MKKLAHLIAFAVLSSVASQGVSNQLTSCAVDAGGRIVISALNADHQESCYASCDYADMSGRQLEFGCEKAFGDSEGSEAQEFICTSAEQRVIQGEPIKVSCEGANELCRVVCS